MADVSPAPPPAPAEAVTVKTVGRGEAWFIRDGHAVKGQWEKRRDSDRTVFTLTDGSTYSLGRGSVWIEVVPNGKKSAVVFE